LALRKKAQYLVVFLYYRYESVMNLFVVVVDFKAFRAILTSVDLVFGLCLLEV
jgi:hypothetical protein